MSATMEKVQLTLNCVNNIREFDGTNPSLLPEFIHQAESVLITAQHFTEANKRLVFMFLKNRCTGKTIEALHRAGPIDSWLRLKGVLVDKFGEQSSVTELMDKLIQLNLNGTIEKFYLKIQSIINRINNRNLTHSDPLLSLGTIERTALTVFKNHLPEPTKTIIFSRNPNNLEDAYKIILEVGHQFFTQYGQTSRNTNGSYRNLTRNNNYDNRYNHQNQNFSYNRNNNYDNTQNNRYNSNNNNYKSNNNNYNRYNRNNYNQQYNQVQGNSNNNNTTFSQNTRNTNNNVSHNNYNHQHNQIPNNNNNNNRHNYNNNNRTFSQNTRNSSYDQQNYNQANFSEFNRQSRDLNTIEPVEIEHINANFHMDASSNFPI